MGLSLAIKRMLIQTSIQFRTQKKGKVLSKVFALTTFDNPFDVFEEFEDWSKFDQSSGHFTAELLARVNKTSDELSEKDQNLSTEQAIDDIIALDAELKYRKVSKEID